MNEFVERLAHQVPDRYVNNIRYFALLAPRTKGRRQENTKEIALDSWFAKLRINQKSQRFPVIVNGRGRPSPPPLAQTLHCVTNIRKRSQVQLSPSHSSSHRED